MIVQRWLGEAKQANARREQARGCLIHPNLILNWNTQYRMPRNISAIMEW